MLREELAGDLRRNSQIAVYPSQTNLILVETRTSAQAVVERMRRSNVFIRNCDSMGARFADRFLRIAVKHRAENSYIADTLFEATNEHRRGELQGARFAISDR